MSDRGGDGIGTPEERKIIDEALRHLTSDKVRIEDMKKMAEDESEEVDKLVRFVLNEIININQKNNDWAVSHGAKMPSTIRINFAIQTTIMSFIESLIKKWQYAASSAMAIENIKNFKEILDEKDWRKK
jgi:hypothetical protein